jgi:hypothetical protein
MIAGPTTGGSHDFGTYSPWWRTRVPALAGTSDVVDV